MKAIVREILGRFTATKDGKNAVLALYETLEEPWWNTTLNEAPIFYGSLFAPYVVRSFAWRDDATGNMRVHLWTEPAFPTRPLMVRPAR